MPRVYGNSPGFPRSRSGSKSRRSDGWAKDRLAVIGPFMAAIVWRRLVCATIRLVQERVANRAREDRAPSASGDGDSERNRGRDLCGIVNALPHSVVISPAY